ncbi:MAG: ECF transporter S component [Eubacterium sp.]|nr:ECF transporter S component [Eubacterium sp.]
MKNSKTKKADVKKITMIAMLTAIGVVLQYLEISIPFVPAFIKLDFADLPELVGAFVCGPVSGVLICLMRNVIHMLVSQSGFIGELSNFILGAVFALTAGIIYKKMPNFKGVIIGGVVGAIVMGIISLPSNYFLIYPLYYNVMGFPEPAILEMYQLIRPSTKNIAEALLVFNVPFTIVKALICVAMSVAIYKPLHGFLSKIKG